MADNPNNNNNNNNPNNNNNNNGISRVIPSSLEYSRHHDMNFTTEEARETSIAQGLTKRIEELQSQYQIGQNIQNDPNSKEEIDKILITLIELEDAGFSVKKDKIREVAQQMYDENDRISYKHFSDYCTKHVKYIFNDDMYNRMEDSLLDVVDTGKKAADYSNNFQKGREEYLLKKIKKYKKYDELEGKVDRIKKWAKNKLLVKPINTVIGKPVNFIGKKIFGAKDDVIKFDEDKTPIERYIDKYKKFTPGDEYIKSKSDFRIYNKELKKPGKWLKNYGVDKKYLSLKRSPLVQHSLLTIRDCDLYRELYNAKYNEDPERNIYSMDVEIAKFVRLWTSMETCIAFGYEGEEQEKMKKELSDFMKQEKDTILANNGKFSTNEILERFNKKFEVEKQIDELLKKKEASINSKGEIKETEFTWQDMRKLTNLMNIRDLKNVQAISNGTGKDLVCHINNEMYRNNNCLKYEERLRNNEIITGEEINKPLSAFLSALTSKQNVGMLAADAIALILGAIFPPAMLASVGTFLITSHRKSESMLTFKETKEKKPGISPNIYNVVKNDPEPENIPKNIDIEKKNTQQSQLQPQITAKLNEVPQTQITAKLNEVPQTQITAKLNNQPQTPQITVKLNNGIGGI